MRGNRVVALVAAAALAGCGGSSTHRAGITSGQQQALVVELEAVRTAAAARDVTAAERALGRFRAAVTALQRDGALSPEAARLMRTGARRILARLKSDNAAPPPTPTQTAPAPPPAPPPAKKPPPGHAKEHKHGPKDKPGKGHGHGEGD